MTSFKIGYRVLINHYGYFGSIGKPYVCFEIKNESLDKKIHDKILKMHSLLLKNIVDHEIKCKNEYCARI